MARKKKNKRKKKRIVTQKRSSLPSWYDDGIDDWSVEQVFNQLSVYGLEMDEGMFKKDAKNTSEPSKVAEGWVNRVGSIAQLVEIFFHLSAILLWKRLLPDLDTFELALDDLIDYINVSDTPLAQTGTEESTRKLLVILDRFHGFLVKKREEEEKELKDVIDDIFYDYNVDVADFLIALPFKLESDGYVNEAVNVIRKFAFVGKDIMMGDLGQILATAGRCDEALDQVEQNLKEFPDDPWINLKAGDVYGQCGFHERAEELFKKISETTGDEYIRMGAYERLESLYEKTGRLDEASAIGDKLKLKLDEDSESFVSIPVNKAKFGRNEPCPCGSGLKYKKCCLNKS